MNLKFHGCLDLKAHFYFICLVYKIMNLNSYKISFDAFHHSKILNILIKFISFTSHTRISKVNTYEGQGNNTARKAPSMWTLLCCLLSQWKIPLINQFLCLTLDKWKIFFCFTPAARFEDRSDKNWWPNKSNS